MTRAVPEWIGKTDDAPVPPRVRLRVFERSGGRCAKCERRVMPGDPPWACDHVVAIINGGANRETNLQMLCDWCHKQKTRSDVALKSDTYATRMAHFGFRRTSKRPMPHGKNSPTKRKVTGEVVPRRAPI